MLAYGYTQKFYRRAHDRFRVDGAANLIMDETLQKPLIVKDVCVRGAGVICDYPLAVGQRVFITIVASLFSVPLRRDARIVWCKKIDDIFWQAGLDFGINNTIEFK